MSATYVYGVASASLAAPDTPGIGGEPVALVVDGELAALTSPLPDGELTMGREALDTHADVLSAAHAHGTVLPMRFGVVMADALEVVERLLAPHRDELAAQLTSLAGTVELKVRASYDEQVVLREIVAEDRGIARLREAVRGESPEASYYAQIRLGELVAAALARKRERDAASILDALTPLALATEAPAPPHEHVVLAASFLVARERIEAFDAAVNRVGEAQAGRMNFRYTGPLPPHSFVALAQEV